jgi:hypothetical protein
MCDEQLLSVQKSVLSVARREPKITLRRTEEIFLAFKDSVVSVLCLCVQKELYLLAPLIYHIREDLNPQLRIS